MTHQPAISFSISFHFPFNRAGGRTSNVRPRMRALFSIALAISVSCRCLAEEPAFAVSLIPIVDAKSALTVEYQAGLVTIRHRDGTRVEKRIDAQKSEVIEKAIASAPTEKWKGFWQTLSIDGDIVLGEIVRDGETFRFQGLNGCPPGFAAILSALNAAGERRLFTANWKLQEEESEFHEKSPFAFTKSFDADHNPAEKTTGEQGARATATSRPVGNIARIMNLNSRLNARPRQWRCVLFDG